MTSTKKQPTKKTTKPNKGGRPQKEIDFNVVDNLCARFCTGEEVAAILNIDYDTLNTKIKQKTGYGFSDYFKRKSPLGRASLRRKQFEIAMTGNTTMLIWLGKQHLGQKEPHLFITNDEQAEAPEFTTMTNKEIEDYIRKNV